MFRLTQPSPRRVALVREGQRGSPFSYAAVGATREGRFPPGFRVDRNSVQLGAGARVFAAAKDGLRAWTMMDLGWLRVFPAADTIAPGMEVAVAARHFGFWSVNVTRVVWVEETGSGYAFAYGTLGEHAESGEERFSVSLRGDGGVWYEILAFSRPRHPLARIASPLARRLQRRFALDSLERMRLALMGVT